MRVYGEILTAGDQKATRAHFCKNDGKEWDLHAMACYIQSAYDAVEKDADANAALTKGLETLRKGPQNG